MFTLRIHCARKLCYWSSHYPHVILLQINKEKCQALVEFLTPEDATAALSFDGRSLFGSVLKIRRPKDFVEAAVRILILFFPYCELVILCTSINMEF